MRKSPQSASRDDLRNSVRLWRKKLLPGQDEHKDTTIVGETSVYGYLVDTRAGQTGPVHSQKQPPLRICISSVVHPASYRYIRAMERRSLRLSSVSLSLFL